MAATRFQYALPSALVGTTNWSGSATDVDEPPPFNDSDVNVSPSNSAISGLSFAVEYSLTSATNPLYYSDGWYALVRAQKNSASNTQVLQVELRNGGSTLVSWNPTLTTTLTTLQLALTSSDASSIPSGAYSGGWSLRLTALAPSGSGNNFVTVSGMALQLPTLGFSHLDLDPSGVGFKVAGAHAGSYLILDSSGVGYRKASGSETTGALIVDSAGAIKVHP